MRARLGTTDDAPARFSFERMRVASEWMAMMSDALLAQSAIDRLTSGAHTLIIEGPSYRQRDRLNQRASLDTESEARNAH